MPVGPQGTALRDFLVKLKSDLSESRQQGLQAGRAKPRPLSGSFPPSDPSGVSRATPEQMPSPLLLAALTPTLVGDVTGLGLDIHGFSTGELEPTPLNIALAGVGLLPLIPAASSIRKVTDQLPFIKKRAEDIRVKTQELVDAKRELGFVKAEASKFFPENFTAFDDDFLETITIAPSGFFSMSDDSFRKLLETSRFSGGATVNPKKALKEFRALEKQATEQAALVDKLDEATGKAMEELQSIFKDLPKQQQKEIAKQLFREVDAPPPSPIKPAA